MVRNYPLKHFKAFKHAFTMIELIFAIVVVGVTMLTIPLMIQANNQAIERTLSGEAIFLASSVAAVATTSVWDNRSIVDTGDDDVYVLAKILDVNDAGTQFGRIDTDSNIRVGGLNENRHRQFFDFNNSAGAPDGGYTRPEQVGTDVLGLTIDNSASDIAGYKQAYTVTAERSYVSDAANVLGIVGSGGRSNLKMIEVTVPVVGDVQKVVFRAYIANIGEVDYEKRSF